MCKAGCGSPGWCVPPGGGGGGGEARAGARVWGRRECEGLRLGVGSCGLSEGVRACVRPAATRITAGRRPQGGRGVTSVRALRQLQRHPLGPVPQHSSSWPASEHGGRQTASALPRQQRPQRQSRGARTRSAVRRGRRSACGNTRVRVRASAPAALSAGRWAAAPWAPGRQVAKGPPGVRHQRRRRRPRRAQRPLVAAPPLPAPAGGCSMGCAAQWQR